MRKLCLLLLLLPFVCLSQTTYYNPSQKLDINITVKEPFKRVNYAEVGQNFNNAIQSELAKREALKKYYENIYYETKNSIYENSIFTNDYNIDNLINKLQSTTIKRIDLLYNLLTQGQKQPNVFESDLKKVYYEYNNNNRQLAYISKYKYQKTNSISSPNDLSEFNIIFERVINSISSFTYDYQGNINFEINEIIYDGSKSINNILTFISMVCDKQINLDELKQKYDNKVKDEVAKKREEMQKTAYSIFGFYWTRYKTINSLNENERKKYLKNELKFIKKRMPNSYMNYFSKSDDFIAENVIFNIVDKKIIINMEEEDESKVVFNESFFNQSADFNFLHGLLIYLKDESGVKIIPAQ
jgi:hypothetical protein